LIIKRYNAAVAT